MTKTDTQKDLDSNIPESAVRTREGGGKTFSYLETWHVIDRLNQILGQGNWAYQVGVLTKVFEGEIEQYNGKAFTTSYTATVYLNAVIDGKPVVFSDVGYGDGTDKKSPGKAHELATKEAVSDAMKRAAKNLGRSMGLALYDKTQEYVGVNTDNTTKVAPIAQTKVQTKATVVAPNQSKEVGGNSSNARANKPTDVSSTPQHGTNGSAETKRPIKELITSAFKVLEAQKKITKEEFKTKYQKGAGLSTLSEPTLQFIYNSLKTDFPGLGL